MATLAADKVRVYERQGDEPVFNDIPAIATDIMYAGSAIGITSGTARPCTTADEWAGFCVEQCDNSAGAASAKNVKVRSSGYVALSIIGVTANTHINDTVYLTDDDTFTLTASGGLAIGKIFRWEGGAIGVVKFESLSQRSI